MGILDDAIREHLELKRQHGADGSELEQLEGEAFGPTERPGSEGEGSSTLAEAPTEFMVEPDLGEPEVTDMRSAPTPADAEAPESAEQARPRNERPSEIADLQEAPEPEPVESAEEELPDVPEQAGEPKLDTPPPESFEEESAMEHKAIPEPPPAASQGPSTEERQAIADPPTELYDVEGEEFGSKPQAPTDEELVEEEIAEPRLAPSDPLSSLGTTAPGDEDDGPEFTITEAVDEEEDDFFDEKRLSDELDQALDAPLEPPSEEVEPEPTPLPEPRFEPEPTPLPIREPEPEPELEPGAVEEPEPEADRPAPKSKEDVLEETPDFLEEAPEDDELWFEQKPPKDFDFDD